MTFAVFVPPQALNNMLPVLWYLSGLACTHANVMEKGEYRKASAETRRIIVCPDTSPRGEGVPNVADNWKLGCGTSFYVDATEAPWLVNYQKSWHVNCVAKQIEKSRLILSL
jgi:S-formylglutathione hydrolase